MSLQDNFRQAMRSYIYSVSVMSNVDSDGDFSAITVSSVTSVSLDPPSLLVCINKSAGIHNTIKEGSSFCINLLNKNQEYISNLCSSFQTEGKRFNDQDWDLKNIPFLKSAQANIFCTVDKLISYHTHTIVIGHVTDSFSNQDINTLTYVDGTYQ